VTLKVITSKIEQKLDTFLVSARYLENESNRIYVNLDTQALCIHMFATRLSHLRCVTDFHFSISCNDCYRSLWLVDLEIFLFVCVLGFLKIYFIGLNSRFLTFGRFLYHLLLHLQLFQISCSTKCFKSLYMPTMQISNWTAFPL
jgi:hypothetical protein